jgi:hypothetical protein
MPTRFWQSPAISKSSRREQTADFAFRLVRLSLAVGLLLLAPQGLQSEEIPSEVIGDDDIAIARLKNPEGPSEQTPGAVNEDADDDEPDEGRPRIRIAESRPLGVDDFDGRVFGNGESDGAERSRKLFEIVLELKISTYDWACRLTAAQRRKLVLAGHGDIQRMFQTIDEHRRKFASLAESEPPEELHGRQWKEASSAQALLESDPFGEGSLIFKTLKNTLTAEQTPQYEAVRAIARKGGRVKMRSSAAAQLREIDLHRRKFTDSGMALVGNLQDVQILNLGSTRVTDAGLFHLRGLSDLEELDLSDTRVTDAGLIHLQNLKRLRKLNLGGTEASDATLLLLKESTNFRHVGLFGTRITDIGLEAFRDSKSLEVLDLGGTQITDLGIANLHLAEMTHLKELDLQRTRVTDIGLRSLSDLNNIEVLDLRGTQFTDAGVSHLRSLTSLKELFLQETAVTETAVADLNESLPKARIYK